MEFFFASILLEKNRWTQDKIPAYSPANRAAQWFKTLGERITHCHLNLFGLNGDIRNQSTVPDLDDSIRLIGHSKVRTVSLEFTQGVGEESEYMANLFASALTDRAYFQSEMNSNES